MRVNSLVAAGLLCFGLSGLAAGQTAPSRLVPEDLYKMAGPQSVVVSPQGDNAAAIYRRVDPATKAELFSLWLTAQPAAGVTAPQTDAGGPLEAGEPDARAVTYSPDGRWLAVRSTRPRPEGWKPTPAAPPQSDPATDIWLVSTDGKQALPLAGPDKPYGRVFVDPFYGRVAFSPDGQRLAFIADDGRDPRTPAELEAGVQIVRPDQGEGYTGFGTAQVWIAELDPSPKDYAAKSIRRLTDDDVWYGDPQWTPDGQTIICHANKSSDTEAVRYSINKNYDLWAIDVASGSQRRLTFGPGAEVSPRIAPDGKRLICLSSPRKGPHADVFNLLVVSLTGDRRVQPQSEVLFDHHADSADPPPHPIPSFPLPDECWDGDDAAIYTSFAGVDARTVRVDLASKQGRELAIDPQADLNSLSPLVRRIALQRRLSPPANPVLEWRLKAEDRVVKWQNEGFDLEGILTLPPPEIALPPYPLVLYPHGGPHSRSIKGFNFTAHAFAHAGYAVFQPNFRGSAGYGRKFLDSDNQDLGGGDMRDILAGADMLIKDGLVDRDQQFVYGISYGGYMTTWLVGHTPRFRAAVAQNAVTEMNVMWGLSDIQSWTEHELRGRPWEIPARMREHSPLTFVDQVSTPTLILHSRDDRRCPLPMGRMFYQSLLERGVPTQMVIYPDEGHGIKQPQHQVDVLQRTLAWFAAHDVTAPVEIVMLGDSITKGVRSGVTTEQTFAAYLEKVLHEKGIAARVTNSGVGSETTTLVLARLERDAISPRPRIVTIMYGTNDSWIDQGKRETRLTLDEFRDNTVQLVERLRRAGITPILMTEPSHGKKSAPNGLGEHPNLRLEKYVAATREIAKELGVPLIDHYADWTAAESKGQDLTDWTTDQYHPNPTGHAHMAEVILPAILNQIEKYQAPAR
jgi:dipeptidyl aminopeptidase/acylaminoacyl peptidase/lysophospholipase L1-like esterase